MMFAPFAPLPQQASLTLGGLTLVKPGEWNDYIHRTLQERFDIFPDVLNESAGECCHVENDCVLQSLEQHLFEDFGTAVPKNNLFKIYNQKGEGVSPDQMLEAIMAVIEPLGFEIDRVLVADNDLAVVLDWAGKVEGLDMVDYFDGKPGICMINVRPGYNHAFYWKKMQKAKFFKSQFRIAVLIRRRDGGLPQRVSALECLHDYCCLVLETVREPLFHPGLLSELEDLIEGLGKYAMDVPNQTSMLFRHEIDARLERVIHLLKKSYEIGETPKKDVEWIQETGEWVRRIFRELDDKSITAPAPAPRSR
jgi:hypothetical protein